LKWLGSGRSGNLGIKDPQKPKRPRKSGTRKKKQTSSLEAPPLEVSESQTGAGMETSHIENDIVLDSNRKSDNPPSGNAYVEIVEKNARIQSANLLDTHSQIQSNETIDQSVGRSKKETKKKKHNERVKEGQPKSKNWLERFAYDHFSRRLPSLPGFKETYEASFIPVVLESYLSTALLLSAVAVCPIFGVSVLVELLALHLKLGVALFGSGILGATAFALSMFVFLVIPIEKRRELKSRLEGQLAYSFGVLGVLAASGMNIDRLFERMAETESNPVLSDLARRFLRNVKIFGLDTEASLREVAKHSPSEAFSRILESIAVAFKATGSLKDLITFESARLLADKKEKLKKSVNSLAVTAELYVTIVVVGPIIFIVMLTIFLFLPTGGNSILANPTILINAMVFLGIPVISVIFLLMLDSLVSKV
jgi:Flp pilus assembly protein TadB